MIMQHLEVVLAMWKPSSIIKKNAEKIIFCTVCFFLFLLSYQPFHWTFGSKLIVQLVKTTGKFRMSHYILGASR